MIIQRLLIISAGIFLGTFCLQGMHSTKKLNSEEETLLLRKWRINNLGICFNKPEGMVLGLSFEKYMVYPLQRMLGAISDPKETNQILDEFKKILSIVLNKNSSAGHSFIKNFIAADYQTKFFSEKNIDIQQFLPYCGTENLPEELYDSIVKDPSVVNYCIYNCALQINDQKEGLTRLAWTKNAIKKNGFRVHSEFYNNESVAHEWPDLKPQTPEARVDYFKEMLKPRLSGQIGTDIVQKSMTLMLCLKDLRLKVPKPILIDCILAPLLLAEVGTVFSDVHAAVKQHKKAIGTGRQDEVDRFLSEEFQAWYIKNLGQCIKNYSHVA